MVNWSKFTPDEIERGRLASVGALQALSGEEFGRWYQEQCDRLYWTRGQCCAGCDHWRSDMGNTGQCAAAGIVSGADVLQSADVAGNVELSRGRVWAEETRQYRLREIDVPEANA